MGSLSLNPSYGPLADPELISWKRQIRYHVDYGQRRALACRAHQSSASARTAASLSGSQRGIRDQNRAQLERTSVWQRLCHFVFAWPSGFSASTRSMRPAARRTASIGFLPEDLADFNAALVIPFDRNSQLGSPPCEAERIIAAHRSKIAP